MNKLFTDRKRKHLDEAACTDENLKCMRTPISENSERDKTVTNYFDTNTSSFKSKDSTVAQVQGLGGEYEHLVQGEGELFQHGGSPAVHAKHTVQYNVYTAV